MAVLFWWWYFSMWCPYARVSLHAPSSLQRCDLSLLSYIILNLSFCFPFFFFGGGVIHLFTLITSMVLHQWPKNKIKTLKTPASEIFVFDVLLWGLHPHTFSHLAHIITVTLNPPPLKIVLVYLILFLILCWNVYFYSVFRTSTKFAPKIGP